jgi:hypothetical protein
MRLMLVAGIVACVCAPARADDLPKAQTAYRLGTQHYDLGEYREALEAFKEAYRNHEDPTFLFNLAQCYRQLGDKQAAIRAYRTYLIKVPDSPKRDQIREMVAKLDKQLAEEQASKSSPPQGTLSPSGPPPAETRPPGETKPTLDTKPSETKPPAPPDAVTTLAPPEAVQPPSAPAASMAAGSVAETRAPTPVYKRWWLWTVVGVVVVGAAVGVGVGVAASRSTATTPTCKCDFGTFRY